MTHIHIEGIEPLLAKVKTLAQLKGIAKVVKAAAVHVKGKLATYPAQRHGPQPFKTDKSRRFFFWALKNGKIDVPYRRGVSPGSERLGSKWTIRGTNAGLTQTLGNNTSYGRLVQSDKGQTAYHAATGWKTVEQVAHEERGLVVDFIREGIERLLS
jgi:hypothetical protein